MVNVVSGHITASALLNAPTMDLFLSSGLNIFPTAVTGSASHMITSTGAAAQLARRYRAAATCLPLTTPRCRCEPSPPFAGLPTPQRSTAAAPARRHAAHGTRGEPRRMALWSAARRAAGR